MTFDPQRVDPTKLSTDELDTMIMNGSPLVRHYVAIHIGEAMITGLEKAGLSSFNAMYAALKVVQTMPYELLGKAAKDVLTDVQSQLSTRHARGGDPQG